MLPRSRVHFIPAGKAPQRGADAVKACYLPLPLVGYAEALGRCEKPPPLRRALLPALAHNLRKCA
jgi:hypothetical protein